MLSVALALGSNVGDREYFLRKAVVLLQPSIRIVRVSRLYETAPVDAPDGSGDFLNAVALGFTDSSADELIALTQRVERSLGRRRSIRNAPRTIDIDVIFLSATLRRDAKMTLPHPRFREREFVLAPFRELAVAWCDPVTGIAIRAMEGSGEVRAAR